MAVSLPTAADVRRAREQAARNAAHRVEAVRTPLLAVLGAGEGAVTVVTRVLTDARVRAGRRAEVATQRVAALPTELGGLRARLGADELRKLADGLGTQAQVRYSGFAERGERAWGEIRRQPRVEQALRRVSRKAADRTAPTTTPGTSPDATIDSETGS